MHAECKNAKSVVWRLCRRTPKINNGNNNGGKFGHQPASQGLGNSSIFTHSVTVTVTLTVTVTSTARTTSVQNKITCLL
eukprot:350390-Chlamydomonas_euryale.AAC.1